ncbi:MAG TPA: hypothetical protein VK767_02665, partial [Bradyrhizobium sp.]|nr:hypothetical protein [Bradyrhizobium sp.]
MTPARQVRHCEPSGCANARPMTGSAKQSREVTKAGLLRRFAPRNDGPIYFNAAMSFAAFASSTLPSSLRL